MDVTESTVGSVKVAALNGRLDVATSLGTEAKLLTMLASGSKLVADLTELRYVSSAGLRVFLKVGREAKNGGGSLVLAAPQAPVLEVLKMSGFDKVLSIHPTRDEAVASLG